MKQPKTHVSDVTHSRRVAAKMREDAEHDSNAALAMSNAIAANPSLLDGLGAIVARLALHEESAKILDKVFQKHGRKYPATYRAYVNARMGVNN